MKKLLLILALIVLPLTAGAAVRFNGAGQYIVAAGTNTALSSYTYSFWVNANVTPDTSTIQVPVGKGGSGAGGTLNFFFAWSHTSPLFTRACGHSSAGGYALPPQIPDGLLKANTWYYITCEYDQPSGVEAIFLNGVVQASALLGAPDTSTATSLCIGNDSDDVTGASAGCLTPSQDFPGMVQDVRVFNRALSTQEVSQLYRGVFISRGLVAWYPLTGVGDVEVDIKARVFGVLRGFVANRQAHRAPPQSSGLFW